VDDDGEDRLPAGVRWPPQAELVPCHATGRCDRWTTTRAHHCCVPCRVTSESNRAQPAMHSAACDEADTAARCAVAP
jgi:hypothetical protein